jgi:hypothetical protein
MMLPMDLPSVIAGRGVGISSILKASFAPQFAVSPLRLFPEIAGWKSGIF